MYSFLYLHALWMLTFSQRAEALRLRLQMALFKVNTDQVRIPLDQLQLPVPAPKSLSLQEINIVVKPDTSKTTGEDRAGHEDTQANESEVEGSDDEPMLELPTKSKVGALQLLPMPTLRPTEFSSRKIRYEISSSPPPEASPEKSVAAMSKPATPLPAKFRNVAGLSPEKDLTSSVVKGQAATGLLELMQSS
jgi:hypothetical protein